MSDVQVTAFVVWNIAILLTNKAMSSAVRKNKELVEKILQKININNFVSWKFRRRTIDRASKIIAFRKKIVMGRILYNTVVFSFQIFAHLRRLSDIQ